jgi:hypothetical protein
MEVASTDILMRLMLLLSARMSSRFQRDSILTHIPLFCGGRSYFCRPYAPEVTSGAAENRSLGAMAAKP